MAVVDLELVTMHRGRRRIWWDSRNEAKGEHLREKAMFNFKYIRLPTLAPQIANKYPHHPMLFNLKGWLTFVECHSFENLAELAGFNREPNPYQIQLTKKSQKF